PQVNKEPERDDWLPLLDEELRRLPEKYRVPVVLCELEGQTRKDVARRLNLPEGTLSSRLATARTMLARRLARRGVTLSSEVLTAALMAQTATARVPGTLAGSTVKAAASGVFPAPVVLLTEGVIQAMFLTRLKVVALIVVLLTFVGG